MGPMSHEPGTVRPAGSQARATAARRRRRPESRYGREVRLDSITVQPVVKLDSWPQINSWLSLANLSNSESIMALRLRPAAAAAAFQGPGPVPALKIKAGKSPASEGAMAAAWRRMRGG